MAQVRYFRIRAVLQTAAIGLLILAVAAFAYFASRSSTTPAGTEPEAATRQVGKAKAEWDAVLAKEDRLVNGQINASLKPVDEYFDEIAIPNIPGFLADFTGLFYDTPRFVYKWMADKIRFRGYSDRVNEQVKAALAEHLGFPDEFTASVRGSLEKFQAIQQQRDAELREQAYAILQGAGVSVDKKALDDLLRKAQQAAETTAIENLARDSAINFGGATASKEAAILALQSLIIERAMVALGTRLGIITTGTGAAGATAGAGTATGVGAVPSWAVAAVEIAVVVVVDLALSRWLNSRAKAKMSEQLNEVRSELHSQLAGYMKAYSKDLRKRRAALIDTALSH